MKFPPSWSILLLVISLTLAGCVMSPRLNVAPISSADEPHFDAITFFSGETVGVGKLEKMFSGTEDVLVNGRGSVLDGVLHLQQEVREGEKPARRRVWNIRESAPGHYIGTLSDASGSVIGESQGNRLRLSFVMPGGFHTTQWLMLSPDGQRALNVMKVRKFGITVAVLTEEIRRIEQE